MFGPTVAALLALTVTVIGLRTTTDSTTDRGIHSLTEIPCSKYWDPSPCACYKIVRDDDGKLLLCQNISSKAALKAVFGRLKKRLEIDAFGLVYSRVSKIQHGVFGKAMFRAAHFEKNDIESIEAAAFEGMEGTLASLSFFNNKIKKLDFTAKLKKLNTFFAYKEEFEEVPDKAFANLAYLHSFWVMRCPLRSIGNYAFANTSSLRSARFSTSTAAITKIGNYAFSRPNSKTALRIDIISSQLTDEAFSTTSFIDSNCNTLRITRNNLTTLREDVFSSFVLPSNPWRNVIVSLGNPVNCDSSLKWIATNETARRLFRLGWCYKGNRRVSLRRLKESDL